MAGIMGECECVCMCVFLRACVCACVLRFCVRAFVHVCAFVRA
jgi:hypothetical protein